jgi:hypothetical protein
MGTGVEHGDTFLGKYQLKRKADGPQSWRGRVGKKAVTCIFLACHFRE